MNNRNDITAAALRPITTALDKGDINAASKLLAEMAEPYCDDYELAFKRAVSAAKAAFQQGRSIRQAWAQIIWARRHAAICAKAARRLEIYYVQDQRSAVRARKRGGMSFDDYVWDVIEAEAAERQLSQRYLEGERDVSVESVIPDPRADQLLCEEQWNHSFCGGMTTTGETWYPCLAISDVTTGVGYVGGFYRGVPTEDDDE